MSRLVAPSAASSATRRSAGVSEATPRRPAGVGAHRRAGARRAPARRGRRLGRRARCRARRAGWRERRDAHRKRAGERRAQPGSARAPAERCFSSWPEALTHAGLRPHRRTWTRDAIVSAPHVWAAAHGRPPEQRDWQVAGAEHPPASTVGNEFGSWTAALHVAELHTVRWAWSAEEILDPRGLRAFDRAHGRPPTSQDLRDTRATPYPPATAVARTFGSFRAGLKQLGWHASRSAVADTDILAAPSAYALEHGCPPTSAAWRREPRRPGASVFIRRYGTWSAALTAARR
jgi:hypothetical protein